MPEIVHDPADAANDALATPARILLVFLDGVGIGPADAATNPFAAARLPRLAALLGGRLPLREHLGAAGRIDGPRAVLVPADATLGVPGRPQSGTGQTALLTGRNAAELFGRHFGSWVPTPLRDMLAAENLLSRVVAAGRTAAFANAYPIHLADADARFFRRPAAPPLAARAAGVLTRDLAELEAGRAVASSITHEQWRSRVGESVPDVSAEEAGRRLAAIASGVHFTLFAHYDTDLVGHREDRAASIAVLERVDAFLGGVTDALPGDVLLVVASDHGNVEEVSGGHTLNPVPVLAVGPGREHVARRVRSLLDVAPALLGLLGAGVTGDDPRC